MSARLPLIEAYPTRYWRHLDDGRVQCDVCPRACKLREGQRGLCFVRACQDGEIDSVKIATQVEQTNPPSA